MLSETWTPPELVDSTDCEASEPHDNASPAPAAERHSTRLDNCLNWLGDAHRHVASRLFQQEAVAHSSSASPSHLVFVPRSQPERAHTIPLNDLGHLALTAALAREEWFVQETAIDTALGPTGRLQLRLRAEWVIGPPAIKCASLRPRQEPSCIVSATAELPFDAREPRLLDCVVCYDDARIAA